MSLISSTAFLTMNRSLAEALCEKLDIEATENRCRTLCEAMRTARFRGACEAGQGDLWVIRNDGGTDHVPTHTLSQEPIHPAMSSMEIAYLKRHYPGRTLEEIQDRKGATTMPTTREPGGGGREAGRVMETAFTVIAAFAGGMLLGVWLMSGAL